jgi:hypothetical protein
MRTAKEIAEDLTKASDHVRGLRMMNVANKTDVERSEISAELIEAERKLFRLLEEKQRYVTAPTSA